MDSRYENWLRRVVPTESTFRTKLSELRRIEKHYGDVDALYDTDELANLIEDLTYTAADARSGRDNPSKLVIDGDIRNSLASYKSAAVKYARFRQEIESVAADTVSRSNSFDSVSDNDDWRTDQTFSLEKDMQAILRRNIGQIEQGLEIADGNAEKKVNSGFIDILVRDCDGNMVVIELKAVKARREVIGQILAYMGDISDGCDNTKVRGILIAPDFDPKVMAAARMVPSLTLKKYSFTFTFGDVE
jgi:endonuclease NucS-like protein